MFVLENVPLSGYSTMRVGGNARYLSEISSTADITQAVTWAEKHQLPILMVGTGSNVIWSDEGFEGLVLINRIMGYQTSSFDDATSYLTVGSGENWDNVVERSVQAGLSGIEQLSLIPGSTGATPVQNVGAYGREISDVLMTLQAYDLHEKKFITMTASDCGFGYRTSRFKTTDRDRFLITSLSMILSKRPPIQPFYHTIQMYLKENDITEYSAQNIRKAVIAIRQAKLPDPAHVSNCGSFFQNPIIPRSQLTQLVADYPDVAYWDVDDYNVKLSAAWLIEAAGFKGMHDKDTGMATWPAQPLVFINESAHSASQVLAFRDKVASGIKQRFNVELQQEPELLP
ncbi:UDP-N-acetylmuramate dehydrogenase [soil metagenome]